MAKKYRVTLTADERDERERLLARGKADVQGRCSQDQARPDPAQGR
jgi:hypothetical protein